MDSLRKVLLVGEIAGLANLCQSLQLEERESWSVKLSSGDRSWGIGFGERTTHLSRKALRESSTGVLETLGTFPVGGS